MDHYSAHTEHQSPWDSWVNRGLRIARRMAVAFGLSTVAAIGLGAAVTDNAFAQIVVTVLAAIGLWLPFMFLLVTIENIIGGFRRRPASAMTVDATVTKASANHWQRLSAAAPGQGERLQSIQRSLDRSRSSLGTASLDPGAHDLCVLIDRRLPELIDHQLDSLPPDDRGRKQQISDLVDLVEQFARHCSRQRDSDAPDSSRQAEVLRQRFAESLGENDFRLQ